MLTRDDAKARAQLHLDQPELDEVVILDDATIEFDLGWVFFYQSREYILTGETGAMLVGNAPLIVNRVSGEVTLTGTAQPVADYIAQYRARGGT